MSLELFEAVLQVTLESIVDGGNIEFCYPPNRGHSDQVKQAPAFCFPEQQSFRTSLLLLNYHETFSFTLTESDGTKVFGYCRRYLRSGVPTCICILTFLPSYGLFTGLLNILESLIHQPDPHKVVSAFLYQLENIPIPLPGHHMSLSFDYPPPRTDTQSFKLFRPSGCNMLEDFVHFYTLFQSLGTKLVIILWECLLQECRVLLCSKNLGKLTECINAATAILNPLVWQHILIPVLPNSMLDYCTAPMPFLIGVLPASLPRIMQMPTEELYIFNLDEKSLNHSCNPMVQFLPKSIRIDLVNSLERVLTSKAIASKQQKAKDINIARCFLVCLSKILSGYTNFFSSRDNFNQEGFINADPITKKCRELLSETQIWECFIETQKELYSSGKLDSCILHRIIEWNEYDLDFPCFKCNTSISDGEIFIHKGFPICKVCMKRKKKQITKDNVKQKWANINVSGTRKRKGTRIGDYMNQQKPISPQKPRRASLELAKPPLPVLLVQNIVEQKKNLKQDRNRNGIQSPPNRKLPDIPTKSKESNTISSPKNYQNFNRIVPNINGSNTSSSQDCIKVLPFGNQTPPPFHRIKRSGSSPTTTTTNINSKNTPSPLRQNPRRYINQRCPGCNEIIPQSCIVSIRAVRRIWHPKCFICTYCRKHFDNQFTNLVIKKEKPYHKECAECIM